MGPAGVAHGTLHIFGKMGIDLGEIAAGQILVPFALHAPAQIFITFGT